MIHDSEMDLSWAEPPPVWVQWIGPLSAIWGNPVFQRRYLLRKMSPSLGTRRAFIAGVVLSSALNVFLRIIAGDDALWLGFSLTILIPGFIFSSIGFVRIFSSSMIHTPNELRFEISSGTSGTLLTTPLTDSEIFFAECISGIMRALGAFEESVSLITGLAIPFLLVMSDHLLPAAREMGIILFWWIIVAIMILIITGLLHLLGAYSSGNYAVRMPLVWSAPVAILHAYGGWVFWSILFFAGLIPLAGWLAQFNSAGTLLFFLICTVYQLFLVSFLTTLMAYHGVNAFSRARRPGFYEPEHASAAGLEARSAEKHSFGKSV